MVDACLVTWGAVRSDGNLEVQQVGLVRTLGAPLEGEIGISYILSLSYSQLPRGEYSDLSYAPHYDAPLNTNPKGKGPGNRVLKSLAAKRFL